mmetsp:Transcript_19716/g.27081  ORF Transcript_19716/g.27081 Transcript_19716/m.27081 type:complete len:104 (+) Transcript_19716:867-1178(+)
MGSITIMAIVHNHCVTLMDSVIRDLNPPSVLSILKICPQGFAGTFITTTPTTVGQSMCRKVRASTGSVIGAFGAAISTTLSPGGSGATVISLADGNQGKTNNY